jgi:signal transduction histidine kinase
MRREIYGIGKGEAEYSLDTSSDDRPRRWAEGTDPGTPTIPLALGTREMERIERADEMKRQAETIQIVHDLKNPLATITLELCLLEAKLLQPDVRSRLARVSQNVAFLDRLVQELLDASALDADALRIQRQKTELRTMLESLIERSISSRDRPRVFLDAKQTITMEIDDLRIQRVVCNLLHNALKYSPASSGVVVRLDQRDRFARISITDAGPGLTDDERLLVFDKFGRTADALAHEGHGLGLFISKKIIEAHGGRIAVESARGVGSCFYFELPLKA